MSFNDKFRFLQSRPKLWVGFLIFFLLFVEVNAAFFTPISEQALVIAFLVTAVIGISLYGLAHKYECGKQQNKTPTINEQVIDGAEKQALPSEQLESAESFPIRVWLTSVVGKLESYTNTILHCIKK